MGHGEWGQQGKTEQGNQHGNSLSQEPDWVKKWLANNDSDIARHEQVFQKGYPNRWGARIPINSRWNLDLMESLLKDYEDKEVVEWLRYGWPTGSLPTLAPPEMATRNHKGATDFPEQLTKYIHKEASYGAVMGPYKKIPFMGKVGISPLSTRPKRDSTER